ncbi:hypothetical protein OZ410_01030 [Robiginitalea sp. M366]|uniref:hypothetical protein n=1 Tax=Robiginitalea aestuariiviva TaxID=3036903 RepID=UPI00240DC25E|nr:hypothetical protein [Robiginitalea aestuariiviva]MDG1570882.1 hypothetical protein [Robiginitalea aestuariiviva]
MAPVEFEKNLREKLRARKITPSPGSWERIATQLGQEPVRGRRSLRPWYYGVAAAIALFFGWRALLDRTDPEPVFPTRVVSRPEVTQPVPNTSPALQPEELRETDPAVVGAEAQQGNDPALEQASPDQVDLASVTPVRPAQSQPNAGLDTARITDLQETRVGIAVDSGLEQRLALALDSVVLRVAVLEASGTAVSDATIDSLLHEAQAAMARERLTDLKAPLDANALLSQVESELDRSFREELFNTLKARFNKVRVAMAQRNQ